jgi:hypothetical protein
MYKKLIGAPLQPEKEVFNTKLAIPQVSYEHMIGILKGRLLLLHSIRMRLMGKRSFLF